MAPSAASISIEKQRCLARSYLFGSFHDTQSSVSGDRCISREHARIRNEQTRQQRYRPSPFYGIAENNEPHSGWCVGGTSPTRPPRSCPAAYPPYSPPSSCPLVTAWMAAATASTFLALMPGKGEGEGEGEGEGAGGGGGQGWGSFLAWMPAREMRPSRVRKMLCSAVSSSHLVRGRGRGRGRGRVRGRVRGRGRYCARVKVRVRAGVRRVAHLARHAREGEHTDLVRDALPG